MNFRMTRILCRLLVLLTIVFFAEQSVVAQMFSGSQRPFVTGITPVIGPNGEVGGVSVDAEGFVSRTEVDTFAQLAQVQLRPMNPASADPARQPGKLRKISLRKLEQELVRLRNGSLPLTSDIEYLVGLQRVEYVFVDQQNHDIIIAGPAEDWHVGSHGYIVGVSSGFPVIDFCDLVMMLRNGRNESIRRITCSIDASPKGMATYSTYMYKANRQFNEQTLQEMSEAIGYFDVTFSGVASNSHFARILVAADVMMKRLAMNLEASPVRGVTSYVQMLQKSSSRNPRNVSPRWWLSSDYQPLLRDEQGMAWKIRGTGVKTMTSDDYLNRNGERVDSRDANPLAQRWADEFTKHYQKLSVELPVFGQLRNCMDLAIVGVLINRYDLFEKAGYEPSVLMDEDQVKLAEYPVPTFTQPQISYAPARRDWIVTLSGGVGIDAASVASVTEVDANLHVLHQEIVGAASDNWWWD